MTETFCVSPAGWSQKECIRLIRLDVSLPRSMGFLKDFSVNWIGWAGFRLQNGWVGKLIAVLYAWHSLFGLHHNLSEKVWWNIAVQLFDSFGGLFILRRAMVSILVVENICFCEIYFLKIYRAEKEVGTSVVAMVLKKIGWRIILNLLNNVISWNILIIHLSFLINIGRPAWSAADFCHCPQCRCQATFLLRWNVRCQQCLHCHLW